MPTKKTPAKKTTTAKAKKTTAAKKASVKKTTTAKRTTTRRAVAGSRPAKRGDVIVVDSPQVGTPAREGEVLEIIEGGIGISYRVKWFDGHESIFTPAGGSLHVASK